MVRMEVMGPPLRRKPMEPDMLDGEEQSFKVLA